MKIRTPWLSAMLAAGVLALPAQAADFAQKPLYLGNAVSPLVLLTMQRDHRLFFEAYNDVSDLDGDGLLDTKYAPSKFDYYGYFDSYKCYDYDSGSKRFNPAAVTADKTCTGKWSGDWLNYMTTSRMDALRKVLYGGKRSTDTASVAGTPGTASVTVLERAYIPRDIHSWGREYTSVAVDGYDLTAYTPLALPASGKRHLFANTTPSNTSPIPPGDPLFRILKDRDERIWNWVAKEIRVSDTEIQKLDGSILTGLTPTDYVVRVQVCVAGMLEENCTAYGSATPYSYKPTGVLHKYGASDTVLFGLLTGSYAKRQDGGVLRKNIASFSDEVDTTTGQFLKPSTGSIIKTIDNIQILGFSSGYSADQSWWGNPVAEMMYEGVRYFAGKTAPTDAYKYSTTDTTTNDYKLSLPAPSWTTPYTTNNWCAKPIQMVISDVTPTWDSNSLPGSYFASPTLNQPLSVNVSTESDTIWSAEYGASKNILIGRSASTDDQRPSPKTVTSFGSIRGLVPEDPNKEGSYYAAAIARWAKFNDVNPIKDTQKVDTFAVALASALPKIEIPVTVAGTLKKVVIVPYARASGNQGGLYRMFVEEVANTTDSNVNAGRNGGRPYYRFRVIFGDAEYSGDLDMDAQTLYEVSLTADDKVHVYVSVDRYGRSTADNDRVVSVDRGANNDNAYAVTGTSWMHMGYVISGTTDDATRLVVRVPRYMGSGCTLTLASTASTDTNDTFDYYSHPTTGVVSAKPNFQDMYFCGPEGKLKGPINYSASLPFTHHKDYTPSATQAAEFVAHDPMWYAAKWGGYLDGYRASLGRVDANFANGQLDAGEWEKRDATGAIINDASGKPLEPRAYFPVVNAATLPTALSEAFEQITSTSSSSSSAATNAGSLSTESIIYQVQFDPFYWSGSLLAYRLGSNNVLNESSWNAADKIPAEAARKIFTYRAQGSGDGTYSLGGLDFTWDSLNSEERSKLSPASDATTALDQESALRYLRGARSWADCTDPGCKSEATGHFRLRYPVGGTRSPLGDIINASPLFVGVTQQNGYGALDGYKEYLDAKKAGKNLIVVGGNDGMVHIIYAGEYSSSTTSFDSEAGTELGAFIPRSILHGENANKLVDLVSKNYSHKYYVDGQAAAHDVKLGEDWATVVVGTLGAGGKAVYALNISNPNTLGASSVLWEFTHPELGNVTGTPLIARLPDEHWYAIVGNGVGSSTCLKSGEDRYSVGSNGMPTCAFGTVAGGYSKLFFIRVDAPDLANGWVHGINYFVVHIEDGQVATDSTTVNGLSEPTGLDFEYDMSLDVVYAGDLRGQLWRVQIPTSISAGSMASITPKKLFTARESVSDASARQPITAGLGIIKHTTQKGYMILFGTGRYMSADDIADKSPQAFYGIWDNSKDDETWSEVSLSELYKREIIAEDTIDGVKVRAFSSATFQYPEFHGWYVDLRYPAATNTGERVFSAPDFLNTRVLFVSNIPSSEPCEAGGQGALNELDAISGAPLPKYSFDIKGDGFSEADLMTVSGSKVAPASIGIPFTVGRVKVLEGGGGGGGTCVGVHCEGGKRKPVKITVGIDGKVKATINSTDSMRRTSWRQLM